MSDEINQDPRRFPAPADELGVFGPAEAQSGTARPEGQLTIEDERAAQQMAPAATSLLVEGRLPSLDGATAWLNSQPLTAAGLRGHVVLVDFWTYTCINWLRTLPYIRAWAEKYKDQGLVGIGVHTPDFPF